VAIQKFLQDRFAALDQGDYAADLDSYLCFARQQLSEIKVRNWQCLQQRSVDEQQIEAILVIEIDTVEGPQFFYELALLIETADGWRYHSAQKLGTDDYPGTAEQLDFCHFDNASQKIRF